MSCSMGLKLEVPLRNLSALLAPVEMSPAGPEFTESSEESVSEEASPPRDAPGTTAKAKAAPPRSSSETSGEDSNESMQVALVEAREARRARAAESETPWRPQPDEGKGRGKGKRASTCQYCWRPLTSHPSGQDQHQWTSLQCLQWQHYLRGGVSWNEAREMAWRTKAARMDPDAHIPPHPDAAGSGIRRREPMVDPPPPPPPSRKTTVREESHEKAAPSVPKKDANKKEKKHKKEKDRKNKKEKKSKRHVTPSPEPRPRRKRDPRDPSPDDDGHKKSRAVPTVHRLDATTWVVKLK
ncbi:unnamed protein product [Cladocopium goreaui]|uniref:Uncharacterized protein n=1 Tax=Cladocopium goreaui TaxID=2562237 RepID=A0A9P1BPT1_9DINO|nr:unnamed protein product [Cladocopium goreaui]